MTSVSSTGNLTASVLTPSGRGAVATIRVCGSLARLDQHEPRLFSAVNNRSFSEQSLQNISFGKWGHSPGEDVVICRIAQNELEIHCHGGNAAVRRIMEDLNQAGCMTVSWQTQLAEKTDFLTAECLDALSRATTTRTAMILLEQSNGLLKEAFVSLRDSTSRDERLSLVSSLLQWSNFGRHLVEPWKVVLTGRPNVGKSSLMNRLLGYERAIVFDQPGTTRDIVTGDTAFDGWPVRFSDTAGLREIESRNDSMWELEAAGIELARKATNQADVQFLLIDLSQPPTDDVLKLMNELSGAIVIAHKCDQPDAWRSNCPSDALRVSSVTGEGLDSLRKALVSRIVPQVPSTRTAIPVTERQISLLESAYSCLSDSSLDDDAALMTSRDIVMQIFNPSRP